MKEFEFREKEEFRAWLNKSLEYLGKVDFKPITVTIKSLRDSVSRAQHKYIFGCVMPTLQKGLIDLGHDDYIGMDVEDFEMEMRTMHHHRIKVVNVQGYGDMPFRIPKRLALGKAHKDTIASYITKVIIHANEAGIYIPPPDKKKLGLEE